MSYVFGPIPSRRLGRSLGINNIPEKICSYSCVYCQIGATDSMSITRKEFYPPSDIGADVVSTVHSLRKAGEKIDYLTFVPDGEPTLDINLGKEIDLLKHLDIPVAVITNSSLLWDADVRSDLMKADWVSVKIDTVDESLWHRIDRPNGKLRLSTILDGIQKFASEYRGTLVTETMMVRAINDSVDSIAMTAEFVKSIRPSMAYILVPTRPPAEHAVEPPTEESLTTAYHRFSAAVGTVELLVYNEGNAFTFSSDAERELLNIIAVHPMRMEAVRLFLLKANAGWNIIDRLLADQVLKEIHYGGYSYFVKVIKPHQ